MNVSEDGKKSIFSNLTSHAGLFSILMLLFLLCIGYNISTRLGLFPDETQHLGFVINVIKSGFPDYVNGYGFESNKLNYLEHPALYYLLTGYISKLTLFMVDVSYKSFRLVNYFISALTIIYIYKSLLVMKLRKTSIFFAFFPLLSIPMFIMLSASYNNDPLMIFGCTLVFYSFVLFYENDENLTYFFRYFLLGCVITALTKATGALAIVCIISVFFILQNRKIIQTLRMLKFFDWLWIIIASFIVIIYYSFTYYKFGHFFPSAQENPSIWYKLTVPNAPRMGLIEHLAAFYNSNVYTLLDPYGHQKFDDIVIREKFETLVLLMMPFFWIFSFIKLKIEKNKFLQLFLIFFFGYLIFMILYFYEIHALNHATGYPGAMQSRYFYGFIPFFIVFFAHAIDCLINRFIRYLVFSILTLTLLLSFYPSYAAFFKGYYGQDTFSSNYGELIKGRVFEQTFTAQSDVLKRIDIFIGTYQRHNSGILHMELYSDNKLLADSKVEINSISDNSWVPFKFDSLILEAGKTYALKVKADSSETGNAVTWWALGGFKEQPEFLGTPYGPQDLKGNRYLEGLSFVDGHTINGTFTMRIYK
ncbi:ArnT family glycosyltransferase [Pantoea agglomerans]|jgi:hypothetical protein